MKRSGSCGNAALSFFAFFTNLLMKKIKEVSSMVYVAFMMGAAIYILDVIENNHKKRKH